MKRVAILYSGHPRFFGITLQNHLNKFKNDENYSFDFFGHFWKIDYERYKMGYTISFDINFIQSILDNYFISYKYEDFIMSETSYSIDKGINLIKKYELNNNFNYDYVIKIRSDIFLYNEIKSILDLNLQNIFYVNKTKKKNFVDDLFFIVDKEAFTKMINFHDYAILTKYICHELLYFYIKKNNIKIQECNFNHILIKKIFTDEMVLKNNKIYTEEYILNKMKEYNKNFEEYIKKYNKNPNYKWTDIDQLYGMS